MTRTQGVQVNLVMSWRIQPTALPYKITKVAL
jgi:hypothetical protein